LNSGNNIRIIFKNIAPPSNPEATLKVVLIYNGKDIVVKIKSSFDEKALLQKTMKKFKLEISQWDKHELLLQPFRRKVIEAEDLDDGDILILQRCGQRNNFTSPNFYTQSQILADDISYQLNSGI